MALTFRFLTWCSLQLIMLLPAYAATVPPSQAGFALGSPDNYATDAVVKRNFDLMAAANAGYIRIAAFWYEIEQYKGLYNFATTDRMVDMALARNQKVLLLLRSPPRWETGAPDTDRFAANAADFQNIAYQIMKHYIPKGIDAIEILNEENMTGGTHDTSAVTYVAKALKPGYAGAKQASGELGVPITVLFGGLAGAITSGNGNYAATEYLTAAYAAGAKGNFDALADHPYCWPTVSASCFGMTQAAGLAAIMQNNGDGAKKIWATEAGAPTGGSSRAVSEAQQSTIVDQYFDYWFTLPYAGPLFWFTERDYCTKCSGEDNNYGLWRDSYVMKPGFAAFKAHVGAATPPPTGARIQTNAAVNVSGTPNGALVCSQASGSVGTIVGGPQDSGGYSWWNINFDTGCDGWAAQTTWRVTQ